MENCDGPNHTMYFRGNKHDRGKLSKEIISDSEWVNMIGSEYRICLVICKFSIPQYIFFLSHSISIRYHLSLEEATVKNLPNHV